MSVAFVVGPFVLLKENYSCNVLEVGRCTLTKHEKPSLYIIGITGELQVADQ